MSSIECLKMNKEAQFRHSFCIFIHNLSITHSETFVFCCQCLNLTAQTKALQDQYAELEKETAQLKRQLEEQSTVPILLLSFCGQPVILACQFVTELVV